MSHRARIRAVLALAIAASGAQAQQGSGLVTKLSAEFEQSGAFDAATLERPGALTALAQVAVAAKQVPLAQAAYESLATKLSEQASAGKNPRETPALVVEAVLLGLKRTERPVLAKAISAGVALNVGSEAQARSLQVLADLARRHREADIRYAALESLARVGLPAMTGSGLVPDVMVQALDDANPAVVAYELAMLSFLAPRLDAFKEPQRRARLVAALVRLRHGTVPALRAAAIGASAKLHDPGISIPGITPVVEPDEASKAFVAELPAALEDPAPVVRGVAAAAAGLMQRTEAVPRLAALLDDKNDVSAAVGGVRSLESDEPVELPVRAVDIDEPQTVAMAALRALMFVSLVSEPKPELRVECEDPSSTFAACAKRARDWARGRR